MGTAILVWTTNFLFITLGKLVHLPLLTHVSGSHTYLICIRNRAGE